MRNSFLTISLSYEFPPSPSLTSKGCRDGSRSTRPGLLSLCSIRSRQTLKLFTFCCFRFKLCLSPTTILKITELICVLWLLLKMANLEKQFPIIEYFYQIAIHRLEVKKGISKFFLFGTFFFIVIFLYHFRPDVTFYNIFNGPFHLKKGKRTIFSLPLLRGCP